MIETSAPVFVIRKLSNEDKPFFLTRVGKSAIGCRFLVRGDYSDFDLLGYPDDDSLKYLAEITTRNVVACGGICSSLLNIAFPTVICRTQDEAEMVLCLLMDALLAYAELPVKVPYSEITKYKLPDRCEWDVRIEV